MSDRGHMWLAVGLAGVYAVCYSAIKTGLAYAPPLHYAALRAVLGAFTLFLLLALSGRSLLPPRRLWPGVAVLAVVGTLLAYAAMFSAPGRTGAGIASVLGNTTPLLTLALAVPALGERLDGPTVGALTVGLLGASLIAVPAVGDPAHHSPAAALLPLGAAAAFAVSSVVAKRIDARGAELQVAAWQSLLGGAALLGVSAALEPGGSVRWGATFIGLLSFLGVVGTAMTTAVWYWLVQRDDVGRLSITLFIVPVVGLGLGMIVFRERVDRVQGLGAALIVSALAILIAGRRSGRQSSLQK